MWTLGDRVQGHLSSGKAGPCTYVLGFMGSWVKNKTKLYLVNNGWI